MQTPLDDDAIKFAYQGAIRTQYAVLFDSVVAGDSMEDALARLHDGRKILDDALKTLKQRLSAS